MEQVVNKMKKKIYQQIYNIVRKGCLNEQINNIGKIVEEEDKIICYAEQKKVEKYKYELRLYGINQTDEEIRKTIEKLGLNKPIYYIFDGIEFSSEIKISSYFSNHIIFKNCTFNGNIIICGDEVTFENNKYNDGYDIYFYDESFLDISASKIKIINDNFVNSYEYKGNVNFGMKINSEVVEFTNTKVDTGYHGNVEIEAKETILKKSKLNTNEFYIDSKSIKNTDSSLIAKNGAIIENDEWDFVGTIESPIVFYNGIDLGSNVAFSHKVDKEAAKIKEARQKLSEKLRNIRNYCQQLNDDKVKAIKEGLDNQPVSKVLKLNKVNH